MGKDVQNMWSYLFNGLIESFLVRKICGHESGRGGKVGKIFGNKK